MRTISHLHKIRAITKEKRRTTYGVTIPESLHHWVGLNVTVRESGTCLILESGGLPTSLNRSEMKSFSEVAERIRV